MHWNGKRWQPVATLALRGSATSRAGLQALAVNTSKDIWAVGTQNIDGDGFGGETLILHWDGKSWTEVPSLGEGRLLSVVSLSPRDVWTVGYDTNIRRHEAFYSTTLVGHWNGQYWSRVSSPPPLDESCRNCDSSNNGLFGIIATGPRELWALGWSFSTGIIGTRPLILRWDSAHWSIAVPPSGYTANALNGVSLSGAGADLGFSGDGWYQPVLIDPPSDQGCKPVSAPQNPTTRVPQPVARNVTYFDVTGHTLGGAFRTYWQQHGGLTRFGYPITESFQEGVYTVQYFQRARLEWNPALAPQPRVQEALLGSLISADRWLRAPFQPQPPPSTPDMLYFRETEHTLTAPFRAYWEAHGGAVIYGYPISEPFTDVNPADGRSYLVQYFPRQRFEYHPELPEPYRVSLGLLGVEFAKQQGWLP
jgi:hypothetical protein